MAEVGGAGRLRHFQDHLLGFQGVGRDRVEDAVGEPIGAEGGGGEVNREVGVEAFLLPLGPLGGDVLQDLEGQLGHGLRGVLQLGQEPARPQEAQLGVLPADQGLHALHAVVLHGHLGLEVALELPVAHAGPDVLQGQGLVAGGPGPRGGQAIGEVRGGQEVHQVLQGGRLGQDAHAGEPVAQGHVADRLDDAGLQAAGDDQLRGQSQAGDAPDQGDAVHAGHLQVAHHQVEIRLLGQDAQGLHTVGGLGHLGRSQLAHQGGELQAGQAAVVDHQHLAVLDARAAHVGA